MHKKLIFKTAAITSVIIFILTSVFYTLPLGRYVYLKALSMLGATDFSKLAKMEMLVESEFMGEYNKTRLLDAAASGYAGALGDKYTEYLGREDYKSMQQHLKGEYKGIGISVSKSQGKIYIHSVKKDGPASIAGVQIGDYILAVNGKEYSADEILDAVAVIRKIKKDETVVLKIERNGEIKDISIVCTDVDMKYVTSTVIDKKIGYIRIKTFGDDTDKAFGEHLGKLKEEKIESLIIDLRSNGGGSLEAVTKICDMILEEGIITTIKYKNQSDEEYKADKDGLDIPICILINGESASASEVMAGALKDNGKAVLIGEKTYGKGVVQGIYKFSDNTAFKLTVAKYYTPSGVCIDGKGIEPDIEVVLPEDVMPDIFEDFFEGDTQLEAAKEWAMRI